MLSILCPCHSERSEESRVVRVYHPSLPKNAHKQHICEGRDSSLHFVTFRMTQNSGVLLFSHVFVSKALQERVASQSHFVGDVPHTIVPVIAL